MREGPEHRRGWRSSRVIGGGDVLEILAAHQVTRKMPSGHQMAMQHMRGLPFQMAEQTHHSWMVSLNGKRAGVIRQAPSGSFFNGHHSFHRMGIEAAAEELIYRLGIRPRPELETTTPRP